MVGIGVAVVALIAVVAAVLWFTHPYKITYDLDGGEVVEQANPDSYTIMQSVTLAEPERAGFVFAGWEGTGLDGATKDVTIAQGSTGDRAYKAVWHQLVDLKVSKVRISHGDSTVSKASQTVKLSLWGVDADDKWVPIEDVTYSRKSKLVTMSYNEKKKVTTFVLKDGKTTFSKVEDKYTKFMVTAASTEAGFDVNPSEGFHIDSADPATFKLTFNPETWTMKFKAVAANKATAKLIEDCGIRIVCWNAWKDGQPYEPINQHKTAYMHVTPTQKGTTCKVTLWKWDEESTHSYPKSFQTDPQSYYFSADVYGYKLSNGKQFEAKDAPIIATVKVKNGMDNAGDRDAVYLKPGKAKDGSGDYQQGTLVVTLKAKKYSVDLQTDGGKINKADLVEKYTYGSGADLPTEKQITKEGYDFKGWYTKDGTGNDWGEKVTNISKTDTGNVKLYARWAEKTFTVSFEAGKGSEVEDQEVAFGKVAKEPKDPTRKGYEFDGWYTDKLCQDAFSFKTPIKKDTVLYARWVAEK